jgi:hypothetical protein
MATEPIKRLLLMTPYDDDDIRALAGKLGELTTAVNEIRARLEGPRVPRHSPSDRIPSMALMLKLNEAVDALNRIQGTPYPDPEE